MGQVSEFFSLLYTRIVVAKQEFIDFLLTSTTYYGNTKFAKIDLCLLYQYRWRNPFRISRQYLEKRGDHDLYTYGETPLTTMQLIAKRAGISSSDRVLELGSGRGRTCFWLREWVGCEMVGIEQVPQFIDIANQTKERFHLDGITFVNGDYLSVDWGSPTVIYLYGSNLDEGTIELISEKILHLPTPAPLKVISVSFCIPKMQVVGKFEAQFTWGKAEVFIQQTKD